MRAVTAVSFCALILLVSACGSGKSGSGTAPVDAKPVVGVILPDLVSSARWHDTDQPLLTQQLNFAGIRPLIENAQGDTARFAAIADEMIAKKVGVLMMTSLTSDSGAAVEGKAKAAGIPVIDYDRVTLGGSAEYYVSFDNTAVGQLQANGLLQCMGAKAVPNVVELEGAPTDNNATLFHDGQERVMQPRYNAGNAKLIGSEFIDSWSAEKGAVVFERFLNANGGKVDGVLAANDGLAGAAISVLKRHGVTAPVTGQDATTAGLQAVLRGDQCMTVFKPIDVEAEAAARLAIALVTGHHSDADDLATGNTRDPMGNRNVKSVLLGPQAVAKADVEALVAKGVVKASELCAGDMGPVCAAQGIPVT